MNRALLCALACAACGETGTVIDVSAAPDVPPLDALRVEVSQGPVLVTQTFVLTSKPLPQSFAIVSKGMTSGTVSVVVQGLQGASVEALGSAQAELKPASSSAHVAVTLSRLCQGSVCGCMPGACAAGSSCGQLDDGCGGKLDCGSCQGNAACTLNRCVGHGCAPATCADAGAECGQVPDGCNGFLSCGGCDGGTCGGGGANRCGTGVCPPNASCSGLECGYVSDGCAGIMGCGSCTDGGTCGTSAPNICGCRPSSACPKGVQCGAWPDGCGGMLDCGGCDAGTTCGGGGAANACGCTPLAKCPPGACQTWPDGCGGNVTCPSSCMMGSCNPVRDGGTGRECGCSNGKSLCGAQCVDLSTDSLNCGACNNACPGDQTCWGGLCPCVDTTSNSDGHCCPPGWQFLPPIQPGGLPPRCYLGPFDAGSHDDALNACRAATLSDYGRSVSAVGAGDDTYGSVAIPQGVCGSFWQDPSDELVRFTTSATATQSATCMPPCGPCRACTTCACAPPDAVCQQPFYCVLDALGPRVQGACNADYQCPPGDVCTNGSCVQSGPFCMLASDCDTNFTMCQPRALGESGLCQ